MTPCDPWGMPLSCGAEVVTTYGAAVRAFHDRRSGHVPLLAQVVAQDPGFAVGRATAALWAALAGAPYDAQAEVVAARRGRQEHDWERSFVAAVAHTVEQGRWTAKQRWLAHHDAFPRDLMGLMVVVYLLTFGTDTAEIAEAERRAATSLDHVGGEEATLLGFLAMCAQDRGDLDTAHALASRALRLDPTGFVGAHPTTHVFFESGQHVEGLAWLDAWLPGADQRSDFRGHLVWHAALHHLALGDGQGALARYPDCASPPWAGRVIDGPSLLWRCQLLGHVSSATDPVHPPVAGLARALTDDVPSAFLGLHGALALATAGDADGLRRLAHQAPDFTAPGAAALLPDLALGLAAFVEGDHDRAARAFLRIEHLVPVLGGSHAQREVVEDTTIHALIRAGRLEDAALRLRARLDRRGSALDTGLLAATEQPARARLAP